MKRILGLLLAVVLLISAAPYALGAPPNGEIILGLDETGTGRYEDRRVSVVRMTRNGVHMDSDVPAFLRGGRTMVPVRLIAEKLGASVQWFGDTNEVAVTLGERMVKLKIGSALAWVNGDPVTLYDGVPAMVAKYNGTERTMVPLRFVSEYLGAQVSWAQESYTASVWTALYNKTVVLDPGHGGSQTGALYEGVREKDINLAVAKKVAALLEDQGLRVVMTRTEDVDVGLYDRAGLANAVGADIFVSLHANAAPQNRDFTGIYTYHYPNSRKGAKLARVIQTALCRQTGAINRGIETDNFVVLRETAMPAVLAEMGFMTNSAELELLTTPAYQDKLAAGIAEGIVTYLSQT